MCFTVSNYLDKTYHRYDSTVICKASPQNYQSIVLAKIIK